jgi:hypothetical protein
VHEEVFVARYSRFKPRNFSLFSLCGMRRMLTNITTSSAANMSEAGCEHYSASHDSKDFDNNHSRWLINQLLYRSALYGLQRIVPAASICNYADLIGAKHTLELDIFR